MATVPANAIIEAEVYTGTVIVSGVIAPASTYTVVATALGPPGPLGPTGPAGSAGDVGPTGPTGPVGNNHWYSGTETPPPAGTGLDSDIYVNLTTTAVWQKVGGTWTDTGVTLSLLDFDPATLRHVHAQLTPAYVWTITHTLTPVPVVFCYGATGNVLQGDVGYPGPGQVTVTFEEAKAGTAILV